MFVVVDRVIDLPRLSLKSNLFGFEPVIDMMVALKLAFLASFAPASTLVETVIPFKEEGVRYSTHSWDIVMYLFH